MKLFDLHTHTQFSDGRDTVELNARVAETGGLETLALTDHYFGDEDADWLDDYRREIDRVQAISTVKLLVGVEATVLDADGTISLDARTAKTLDIVLCDLGGRTRGIARDVGGDAAHLRATVIACLKRVCESGIVHVLAHPLNLGRFEMPVMLDTFTDEQLADLGRTCANTGVAFEIMNQMCYWFPTRTVEQVTADHIRLARIVADHGATFSLGSDAHSAGAVGNLAWSRHVLAEAGIGEDRMIDPLAYGG